MVDQGSTDSLIKFPCTFILKVVGEESHSFVQKATRIVRRHCSDEQIQKIDKRYSKQGKYIALTFTLYVENRDQLDSLYIELSETPEIIMAL